MKSRIGKLEGDGRTSKRLQESLGKHVKILENALKKEREKVKALQAGSNVEEMAGNQQAGKEAGKLDTKRCAQTALFARTLADYLFISSSAEASQFLFSY